MSIENYEGGVWAAEEEVSLSAQIQERHNKAHVIPEVSLCNRPLPLF